MPDPMVPGPTVPGLIMSGPMFCSLEGRIFLSLAVPKSTS